MPSILARCLGVVLLALLTGHVGSSRLARWFASSERAVERQARENWRQVGAYLAGSQARPITLAPLFSAAHPIYAKRLSALAEELRANGAETVIFWAADEGYYDVEDDSGYATVVEGARERQPSSDLLVVLSAGELPVMASVRQPRQFRGGRLVFLGELSGPSPLFDQAKRGDVTVIARRTPWLDNYLVSDDPTGQWLAGEFLIVGD